MNKITKEQARKELNLWFEAKRVKESKKEEHAESGDSIVEAIASGDLVLTEKNEFKYNLLFPIVSDKKETILKELTFSPRLRVGQLHSKLQGVKASDADGRILAYVSALTNQNSGLLKKMDLEDYNLCQAIVMFFL